MEAIAKVKVVGKKNLVAVPIIPREKSIIEHDFEKKWQDLVDLAARIIEVPAGLIMRLSETDIEVFRSSHTQNNPYEPGEKAQLGLGLYCETVVGERKELLVSNAAGDDNWKNNPDMDLNMLSYYGVPIRWPDGEMFGTFCVLDTKENRYTQDQKQLISKFAELVERDLEIQHNRNQLIDEISYNELKLREMRHRIKNQLNMLISYIDLHRITADDKSTENISLELQNRIRSLYRLHDAFNKAGIESVTPLPEMLKQLSDEIAAGTHFNISIEVSGPEIQLDEEIVGSIILILNELITNSIKHAFTKVDKPKITIDCQENKREVIITYKDNGKAAEEAKEASSGLGTMIVEGIAAQIAASIEKDFNNGYAFRFVIPKK